MEIGRLSLFRFASYRKPLDTYRPVHPTDFKYRKDHPVDGPHLILPSPTPIPPRKVKAAPASLKRPADDDDGIEISEGPVTKKARTNGTSPPHLNGNGNGTKTFLTKSPSKKQILEDEGLIIVDKDDDVIIIED